MKTILSIAVATTLLFATACENKPKFEATALQGTWKAAATVTNGEENTKPDNIVFDFKIDSTYSYVGGSYTENGKWWIDGNKLVTHAEGDMEKRVQLDKVTADSLVILMNDRGTDVKVILLHQ